MKIDVFSLNENIIKNNIICFTNNIQQDSEVNDLEK